MRGHKYTRKVYKNGKWRYYYAYTPNVFGKRRLGDILGFDERQNLKTAEKDFRESADYRDFMRSYLGQPGYDSENVQGLVRRSISDQKPEMIANTRRLVYAQLAYDKTPLAKAEKVITLGKNALRRLTQ